MITILPETDAHTLVIEASEKLTAADYENVFIPKLDELIRQSGKISLVFNLLDSFTGWELEAMWDDAKFGLKHNQDFERVVVVGGPKWVTWMTKLGSHFIHAELKIFDSGSLPEAIAWVKA